ncbi:MAG TPA: ABC transporter permease [Acidimicrobiales bacterium]|nr:ABC transporter permease [Acidimicrobiales bacterium]
MLRVSLRNLLSHKLRVCLTVFAVALGVALMAGTYILTDTINASYSKLVGAAYSGESVVISPSAPLGDNNSAQISPLSQATLAEVRQIPGVARASGDVIANATLLNANGKALGTAGFTYVASTEPPPFQDLEATQGRLPTRPGEAAVDVDTANAHGLHIGDTVEVAGAGPVRRYRLVGVVQFAGSGSFAGASVAVVTLSEAQAVADETGRFGQIDVAAASRVTAGQLRERLAAVLPRDVVVRTGAEQVAKTTDDLASGLSFIRTFLLVFAYVALFVGGFIILNTFSVTVAQRTRETGLVRAMGASRRQVLWSVIFESALIGLGGALAGVGLGVALAPGLDAVFRAFGANLADNGTVIEARTVVVSLLVGLIVSVVAGLAPALRATRVPPLAAIREGAGSEPGWFARHSLVISTAVFLLGVAMVADGLAGSGGGALAGIGGLVVFVGIALFSPRVIPGLARAVGTLVTWRGVTGTIARENTRRQPGRTAVTSAALMVGLALVTFVSVLAAGTKATIDNAVQDSFAGNLIIEGTSSNNQGIPASLASALHKVPGVEVVAPVSFSEARVSGVPGVQTVSGVEPGPLSALYRVQWKKGSVAAFGALSDDQAVITQSFARSNHLELGNSLSLLTASGTRLHLVVAGVVSDQAHLLGQVTVRRSLLESAFLQSTDAVDFVGYASGASDATVQPAVNRLLAKDFPQARSLTAAQFEKNQANQVDSLLGLVYVLLALAVVVSLFGLVNTLALAIHERRRELGLLRAVGASRRQVRQMVRYESVITSLIGAVFGLATGSAFAVALARAIGGPSFLVSFPVTTLLVLVVLAGLAGVAAAALPARRAARLDVLTAIAAD